MWSASRILLALADPLSVHAEEGGSPNRLRGAGVGRCGSDRPTGPVKAPGGPLPRRVEPLGVHAPDARFARLPAGLDRFANVLIPCQVYAGRWHTRQLTFQPRAPVPGTPGEPPVTPQQDGPDDGHPLGEDQLDSPLIP